VGQREADGPEEAYCALYSASTDLSKRPGRNAGLMSSSADTTAEGADFLPFFLEEPEGES
jgi:hypothetical protein